VRRQPQRSFLEGIASLSESPTAAASEASEHCEQQVAAAEARHSERIGEAEPLGEHSAEVPKVLLKEQEETGVGVDRGCRAALLERAPSHRDDALGVVPQIERVAIPGPGSGAT
jgi:hypothetical protein